MTDTLEEFASVEATMVAETMRIRISHAHTLKDGWRCDSTTVEWTGPLAVNEGAIESALLTAWNLGTREAALRNAPQPAMTDEGDPS